MADLNSLLLGGYVQPDDPRLNPLFPSMMGVPMGLRTGGGAMQALPFEPLNTQRPLTGLLGASVPGSRPPLAVPPGAGVALGGASMPAPLGLTPMGTAGAGQGMSGASGDIQREDGSVWRPSGARDSSGTPVLVRVQAPWTGGTPLPGSRPIGQGGIGADAVASPAPDPMKGTRENPYTIPEIMRLQEPDIRGLQGQHYIAGNGTLHRVGMGPVPAPGARTPEILASREAGVPDDRLGMAPSAPRAPQAVGAPGVSVAPDVPTLDPSAVGLTPDAMRPPQQQGGLAGVLAGLSPQQRTAAMLHAIKGDWGELAKMLTDTPQARSERAAADERGKALGQAQAGLPQATQSGLSMIDNIDAVLSDENLPWVTGWQADWSQGSGLNPLTYLGNIPAAFANIPNIGSGPELNATRERIGQLQGQAFLQAFQSLRGAGTISEQEGLAATRAIARLNNLAQSDAGYMQALHDVRREVWSLVNLARTKAGLDPVPYQPHASEPRPGTGAQQGGGQPPVRISGDSEYSALPSGTRFIDPDGNVRIKP